MSDTHSDSKAEQEAARRNRVADLLAEMAGFQAPSEESLVAVAETSSKCGKCGGAVRAMIDGAEPGSLTELCDLHVRVVLYCRDAACGWESVQWRDWSRRRPDEL